MFQKNKRDCETLHKHSFFEEKRVAPLWMVQDEDEDGWFDPNIQYRSKSIRQD